MGITGADSLDARRRLVPYILHQVAIWFLIAVPLILVTATYYVFVPDEFLGLPRQLAVRYTRVFLLFSILWLILRPLGILKHEASADTTSSIG